MCWDFLRRSGCKVVKFIIEFLQCSKIVNPPYDYDHTEDSLFYEHPTKFQVVFYIYWKNFLDKQSL